MNGTLDILPMTLFAELDFYHLLGCGISCQYEDFTVEFSYFTHYSLLLLPIPMCLLFHIIESFFIGFSAPVSMLQFLLGPDLTMEKSEHFGQNESKIEDKI